MWPFKKKQEEVKIPTAIQLKEIIRVKELKEKIEKEEFVIRTKKKLRKKIADHFNNGDHPWSNIDSFMGHYHYKYDEQFVIELKPELESLGYELVSESYEYDTPYNEYHPYKNLPKTKIEYTVIRIKE
jgi:hypothetical protein